MPSYTLSKTTAAAARGDDDTAIVGVYDIYCHPTVRGERTIGKSWGLLNPQSRNPYIIMARAIEAAIAGILFANATMERHKRYEKGGIVCYTDLSDSKRMINDTSTGRRLVPQDTQFKGYLMQMLYYMESRI